MAGRRPGPVPKDPESRLRTNVDPVIGRAGWSDFDPAPFTGPVPPIPDWAGVGDTAAAVYRELSRLPQAALWGPGTWIELHLALPLLERYLKRPGSESFKALISTLGAALRLTEDDLQKARVRARTGEVSQASAVSAAVVTSIRARRARLVSDSSPS